MSVNLPVGEIPFASEVTNDELLLNDQHVETDLRTNVKTPQRTLSLSTLIFQKNGLSEAEALKSIRDLGSSLDQFTRRIKDGSVTNDGLSSFLTKELVEARLLAYDSRKDLSTLERVILKHLYSVLISPEKFGDCLEILQSLGYNEVFDAIFLTYFAGGFQMEVANQHFKIATHYGCRWEDRTNTVTKDVEKDQWSPPRLKHCLGEKKCYCCADPFGDLLFNEANNNDDSVQISAHSTKIGKGHLAIGFGPLSPCLVISLPCLSLHWLQVCCGVGSKVTLDKGVLHDDLRCIRLLCIGCTCVRHDPVVVREDVSETTCECSWETSVVASPPSSQMESLSDQFFVECRLIFAEVVHSLKRW